MDSSLGDRIDYLMFSSMVGGSFGTKMATSGHLSLCETRPPLHIHECWSQLREYF
jgi:hypothetical protein